MTELRLLAAKAVMTVRPFLSAAQLHQFDVGCRGENAVASMQELVDLARQIHDMPRTGEQVIRGDDVKIHLHYFLSCAEWFIVERDGFGDGVAMAPGFTVIKGDGLDDKMGYVSITEIVRAGAELDLHFRPMTLGLLKAERAKAGQVEVFKPGALVQNTGENDRRIDAAEIPDVSADFFVGPILNQPGDSLIDTVRLSRHTVDS